MRSRRRHALQRWACVVWLNGERHRFQVPSHHHIYSNGGDYVVGCALTGCVTWRHPAEQVASLRLEDKPWLI